MVEVSVGKFPVFASGFQLVGWVVGFLSWLFPSVSCLSTRCMDFVEIFNIILDLSITCFSHFSGC